MASMPLASFRPHTSGIRSAAEDSGMRKGTSRRPPSSAGGNWWTPIFGWGTGGPDYITGSPSSSPSSSYLPDAKRQSATDNDDDAGGGAYRGGAATARATASVNGGARIAPVFTEEKARMLRMQTAQASTFHDVMYHSAIASRLASDFQGHAAGSTAAQTGSRGEWTNASHHDF